VSVSGIRWAICKSAPCSRQITTPAPHHPVFYRLDALPAAQPSVKALKAYKNKYNLVSHKNVPNKRPESQPRQTLFLPPYANVKYNKCSNGKQQCPFPPEFGGG